MATRSRLWPDLAPYRDNPTAVKDFRSQLRGNKAIILWSLYLLLLMAITMISYMSIQSRGTRAIADIQRDLKSFYTQLIMMLGGAICLITPALTAGTICVEKQRKSLDLLFSAPVSYKSLLVGKMLSSYRYTWMLLVLSIPLTSICVVMGGATWVDVLQAYAMLSFSAIVMTSIGLFISSLTESVGAAVIWTYLAVVGYLLATMPFMSGAVGSLLFRPSPMELPWYLGINPFAASYVAPSYTVLWDHHVPNWIFVGLFSLAVSKIFLVGSASALSPFGSAESKSFRIHAVLYLFLSSFLCGWIFFQVTRLAGGGVSGPNPSFESGRELAAALVSLYLVLVLFPFLPHLVCYGPDGGFKYGYDGKARWKGVLTGARSGSLGFMALLWGSVFAGLVCGGVIEQNFSIPSGSPSTFAYASYSGAQPIPWLGLLYGGVWTLGFLFMFWGLGQWISSRARTLKFARVGLIASLIVLFGLPVPVLSILSASYGGVGLMDRPNLWTPYLLFPFFRPEHIALAPVYAGVMVVIGVAGLTLERTPRPSPSPI